MTGKKRLEDYKKGFRIPHLYSTEPKIKYQPQYKEDFKFCNPKDMKEQLVWILRNTGDKKITKKELQKFIVVMAKACITGANLGVKQALEREREGKEEPFRGVSESPFEPGRIIEGFDLCSVKHLKEEVEWILEHTGDKKVQSDELRHLIDSTVKSCIAGAGIGVRNILQEKENPSQKRQDVEKIDAWRCYLKTCAKMTPLSYRECQQNEKRKNQEYYPNIEYWKEEAIKGCPKGK